MGISAKDILRLLVDADTSGAVREFEKLGKTANKELGGAEKKSQGFSGAVTSGLDKLVAKSPLAASALEKVGLSTAQLGAVALPALATGAGVAGAAVVAFGAKSVAQFEKTALAADKFRDTTGLSIEESSKWIAVADDVGVSAGTIQSAFVKMQKAIDTNRSAFGDLVATAKDGSVDLTATFLNAITHLQGIEDPIKRANEASRLFGRGFQEVSEIITTDAATLTAALEGVSEAQIIDEEEVAKARRYEAAMDTLGDAVMDIQIAFGEGLAPAVADAANSLATFVELANKVTGPIGGIGNAIGEIARNAPVFGSAMQFGGIFEDGASGVDRFGSAVGTVIPVVGNFIKGLDGVKVSATAAWGSITPLAGIDFSGLQQVTVDTGFLGDRMRAASLATMQATMSADAYARSAGNEAAVIRDKNAALQESINLQLAAVNSTFAVTAATNQFLTANEGAAAAVDDASTAVNEQQMAVDAATQAALGAAAATVQYAKDQAALEGSTVSAKQEQDLLIGTLMDLASTSSGPVAAAIGTVITKLQTVGAQHPNPTISANDQASGTINSVRLSLDRLNGASATVAIDALFRGGAAMSEANRFLSIARQANTLATNLPRGASGFNNFPGGYAIVGEEGPELVHFPKGTDLYPAPATQAMLSVPTPLSGMGGAQGGNTYITVQTLDPYTAVREIKKVLGAGNRVGF